MLHVFRITRPWLRSVVVAHVVAAMCLASCGGVTDVTTPGTVKPPSGNTPALIDLPTAPITLSGIGVTDTITAVIRDATGRVVAAATVTWSSDNSAIAEVTSSGATAYVVARAPGVTRVRASAGTASAVVDIRVASVSALNIVPTALSIRAGDLSPIRATVQGDAGAATTVQWATLNPSIALVDASGIVTGVAVGTTTVLARATADPSVMATATITVMPSRTVSLAPGLTALTLWVGDAKTIPAATDVDSLQTRDLLWSSENIAVATVNARGTIVAAGVGSTIIRVSSIADPRAKAELLLTVLPARTVTVAPASVTVGIQQQSVLRANVVIEDGLSTVVTWSSSDPTVATISPSGLVTGVSFGQTIVTATSVVDTTRHGTAIVSVAPSIRSVIVTPITVSSFVGDVDQLTVDVATDGPLPRTVTWRTSNSAVASVSSGGAVTSVAVGQATISATSTVDTTMRATVQVTVQAAPTISITPAQLNLALSETRSLAGRVTVPPGLSSAVMWRSSSPTIVSVNSTGAVTGESFGTATITLVSVADTTRRATASVAVIPMVRSVAVTPSSASGFVGQSVLLTASVTADGSLPRTTTWRTSDPLIATVSAAGAVTLLGAGQATITAVASADTTKRSTAVVTVVTPLVRSISLTPTVAGLSIGQSQQLSVAVIADGVLPTTVTMRSSNPSVATVAANGVVTALAVGSTTITALAVADTTKRATATITVTLRPVVVSLAPRPIALTVNQSQQLTATVTADPGVATTVTWSSTVAGTVSVSSTGLVTGIAAGSSLISATSVADPTKRDTVTVTVGGAQMVTSWTASRLSGAMYEDVLSTVGFGASAAFSVNLLGNVFRWDGASWTMSARGATYGGQFLAVHGSAQNNVIAVGTNGIVARFDGTAWTQMSSGTTRSLADVWVTGVGAAYAVGAGGTALRLSGTTWSTMTTGSSQTLNGVWATSGTVFAVGTAGEMLRYNGSAWARMTVPTAETLYGISGTSASNVVAVGTVGTILRFDGTTWSLVNNTVSSADFYSVDGSLANNGRMYIASDVGVLQLDGSTLATVSTPYTPRFYTVSVDAVGTVWAGGQRGAEMRNSGGTWTTTNLAPDLLDVWTTSATSAWAVGEFGFVYRFNGTTWTRQGTPTTGTLYAVWGANATDAFAGGDNGVMLRFNGATWSSMSFPSSATINAIWGSSSSDVYAVTSVGEIVRYNGSAWSVVTTNASALWGVYGLSASEIYASGENGTLLRYNGTSWTSQNASLTGTLVGLWGSASNNLHTVGVDGSGSAGLAFRFNGSSWGAQSVGTSRVMTSVWGPTANDVYVTGDVGTMLRFNGTSWTSMNTGVTDLLWSVSGAPSGAGAAFAVGYNSTLVTGTGAGSFVTAAARFGTSRSSLEPTAAARMERHATHALPDGAARRLRKKPKD